MEKAKQWADGVKEKVTEAVSDVLKGGGSQGEHEGQDKAAHSSSSATSAEHPSLSDNTAKASSAQAELKKPPPPANQGDLRSGRGQHG